MSDGLDNEIASALGDAAMLLNNVELHGLGRGRADLEGQADVSTSEPQQSSGATVAPRRATSGTDVDRARIVIDLAPVRREMIRQIVPQGRFDDLTPEERMQVGRQVAQRMRGIADGTQIGAAKLQKSADGSASIGAPGTAAAAATPRAAWVRRQTALAGNQLGITIEHEGGVGGRVQAEFNLPNVLATVFSEIRRDRGEVPFAVDPNGQIFTPTEAAQTLVWA